MSVRVAWGGSGDFHASARRCTRLHCVRGAVGMNMFDSAMGNDDRVFADEAAAAHIQHDLRQQIVSAILDRADVTR